MFGMVDNIVENFKVIGRREMNMDPNMKNLFYESDYREFYKPYFNDAKELFGIWFWIHISKTADNKHKIVGLGDIKYSKNQGGVLFGLESR